MKLTRRNLNKLAKQENLFLNIKTAFSGMTDCCEDVKTGFESVTYNDTVKGSYLNDVTLGIDGVWSIKGRDLLDPYNDGIYEGIEVYNSCGSFILATKK
jgi:hypothetical protein